MHEHSFITESVFSSCESSGYVLLKCACGKEYKSEEIAPIGHLFTDYSYNDDATCDTDGTETATCSRANCDITDTRVKSNSALGHKFTNYLSDNNATCDTDGTETAVCQAEGCNQTDTRTVYYSYLGHKFTNYFSDNNATCDSDGTKTATCENANCGETHTVTDEGSRLSSTFSVTIHYNNGTENSISNVSAQKTFSQPSDPVKKNYIFTGWYANESLSAKFDFSKPITANTEIYAGYVIDASLLTNTITTATMSSIVMVYNTSYTDNQFGQVTSSKTSLGSGFCFHIQDGVYYFITNCHVAYKEEGYTKQSITVEDYVGNTYSATIYSNSNKLGSAISADYDLAVLRVVPTKATEITKLSILKEDAVIGQDVISLGSPKGQQNAITFGKIYGYEQVELATTPAYKSNVTFDVAQHTATINNGSSGGPLLNSDLQVVGVNYAGSTSTGNGCAIPAKKVWEFLYAYVYS